MVGNDWGVVRDVGVVVGNDEGVARNDDEAVGNYDSWHICD